jgi:hypothetical protein
METKIQQDTIADGELINSFTKDFLKTRTSNERQFPIICASTTTI